MLANERGTQHRTVLSVIGALKRPVGAGSWRSCRGGLGLPVRRADCGQARRLYRTALPRRRVAEYINEDCGVSLGSTNYSYIFRAPFSLEAIWMVREARAIYLDQLAEAQVALCPYDPYIASAEKGAVGG